MARKSSKLNQVAPKRDASGWTTPRQFRLSADTLTELDRLCDKLGGISRSDVVRLAISRLAEIEGVSRGDIEK